MKRSLPVLFPFAVFVFLAFVSWNRWIEPYVDSGRELMVPVHAVGEGARALGKDYLLLLERTIHRDFASAAAFGPGAGPEARIGDPGLFIEVRVPDSRFPVSRS